MRPYRKIYMSRNKSTATFFAHETWELSIVLYKIKSKASNVIQDKKYLYALIYAPLLR